MGKGKSKHRYLNSYYLEQVADRKADLLEKATKRLEAIEDMKNGLSAYAASQKHGLPYSTTKSDNKKGGLTKRGAPGRISLEV